MTQRNERTSSRVAMIAKKVLAVEWDDDGHFAPASALKISLDLNGAGLGPFDLTLADLHDLAEFCLERAAEKPSERDVAKASGHILAMADGPPGDRVRIVWGNGEQLDMPLSHLRGVAEAVLETPRWKKHL